MLKSLPIYHLHNQGVVCQAQNAGKEVSAIHHTWCYFMKSQLNN